MIISFINFANYYEILYKIWLYLRLKLVFFKLRFLRSAFFSLEGLRYPLKGVKGLRLGCKARGFFATFWKGRALSAFFFKKSKANPPHNQETWLLRPPEGGKQSKNPVKEQPRDKELGCFWLYGGFALLLKKKKH